MKMYVLVVGDHYNGVTRVHGVFSSEDKAEQAWTELAYDPDSADHVVYDFITDEVVK